MSVSIQAEWIWSPDHGDYYRGTYDTAGQFTGYVWGKDQARQDAQQVSQQTQQQVPSPAEQPAYQQQIYQQQAYQQQPYQQQSFQQQSYQQQLYQQQSYQQGYQQQVNQQTVPRRKVDSAQYSNVDSNVDHVDRPADPVPEYVRRTQPNFIAGTPEKGWLDQLDESYRMRTGAEAREFFVKGRVFSMLYTEAASETSRAAHNDDAFTVVRKLNGRVHTQIRRFVVVSVRKNFVVACAIFTYKGQGTFKKGCDPGEHAVVYNTGQDVEACYFPGEREHGLYKEPIEVFPADTSSYLVKESRIRFGKIYSIEWNVKVKDIGVVVNKNLGTLVEHYNQEEKRWDTAA